MMIRLRDPFDRIRTFKPPYQRIISLIPSITESLFRMGAGNQLIGITSYCLSPVPEVRKKIRIGGTKNPDIEKIRQLKPDLIIANVEENRKEDVEQLEAICDLYLNFPKTIEDVQQLLNDLGVLTGKPSRSFVLQIQEALSQIKPKKGLAAYFIWNQPYWSIGKDTFIADMLRRQGLTLPWQHQKDRYFPVTDEEIMKGNPDLILLPSEPFRFRDIHRQEIALRFRETPAVRSGKVLLVDGQMISWFGTRTGEGILYLNRILP